MSSHLIEAREQLSFDWKNLDKKKAWLITYLLKNKIILLFVESIANCSKTYQAVYLKFIHQHELVELC